MSNGNRWDFSGWATKTNMRCSDGRTIMKGAFKGCDGLEVPLVWNHRHNDPSEVLGHALLENRDDGVYAYCSFNNSEKGAEARELVRHGDIKSLSIYANQLIQSSKTPPCDVIHGTIREVSLVLAGANPGAFIDNVMVHGELMEDEADIYHADDDGLYFYHADDPEEDDEDEEEAADGNEETVGDILEELTPKQKAAVGLLIQNALKDKKSGAVKHADEEEEKEEEDEEDEGSDSEETIGDVIKTLNKKQKTAVEALIGLALSQKDNKDSGAVKHADESDDEGEEDDKDGETIGDVIETLNAKQRKAVEALIGLAISQKNNKENDSEEENDNMKHNVFDIDNNVTAYVSREDQAAILKHAAETKSSLKQVVMGELQEGGVLAHAITDHNGNSVTYGIANVDYLFPDARAINSTPELINRNQDWVDKVINGTHHTPFSRVKSLFADITGEDARARGYIKANQKANEVIEALKRETNPQTIYKKQKLDRDDIVDITDFDVVAWLKAEMQIMLKAEIARAILISDGRQSGNDKIKENCVRPIYNDEDTYTVKVPVNVAANATDNDVAFAIVDAVIRSRKNYKGSGNPSMFISEDYLGIMLTLKDGMGRYIYETEASLAAKLRVKEIIAVDVMEGQQIAIPTGQGTATANKPLIGVIVNLQDYNVGADKGGATSFFDDFDIDYNQYAYLYETRMSGALIKPYSAMSVYLNRAS